MFLSKVKEWFKSLFHEEDDRTLEEKVNDLYEYFNMLRKHLLIDKDGNIMGMILPDVVEDKEHRCCKLYKGGWTVYPIHYYYKDSMREDEKVDYSQYTLPIEVEECANDSFAVFFGDKESIKASKEKDIYSYVFDNYVYLARREDMSERDFVHYINKYNFSVK